MAHWRHELTRLWHGPPGCVARLTTPSQRPRGPRDPRQGHAFPQGHGRTAHTPLTPARCPHAPPLGTLPPCHTHATSSNSTSPARSASMTACSPAPNSRDLFQQALGFCIRFVAAMRHISYKANAKTSSPQLRLPRKDKASSNTRGPQNKAAHDASGSDVNARIKGGLDMKMRGLQLVEVALADGVSNTGGIGGRHRTRTYDPLRVKQVL